MTLRLARRHALGVIVVNSVDVNAKNSGDLLDRAAERRHLLYLIAVQDFLRPSGRQLGRGVGFGLSSDCHNAYLKNEHLFVLNAPTE